MSHEQSPPPKRRRYTRLPSPIPVHFIDLTTDSPTTHDRPRLGHDGKSLNSANNNRSLDTIIIDETEPPIK